MLYFRFYTEILSKLQKLRKFNVQILNTDVEFSTDKAHIKQASGFSWHWHKWLREFVGDSKVYQLTNVAQVEATSNKIGEQFDNLKALRGGGTHHKKLKYAKKQISGNEDRYAAAWAIFQNPKKCFDQDSLNTLVTNIGVFAPVDLQECDFEDLLSIANLLKKIQRRNFIELVFDEK